MELRPDGRVLIYLTDRETGEYTGQTQAVWPVDAREICAFGDATLTPPSDGDGEGSEPEGDE